MQTFTLVGGFEFSTEGADGVECYRADADGNSENYREKRSGVWLYDKGANTTILYVR